MSLRSKSSTLEETQDIETTQVIVFAEGKEFTVTAQVHAQETQDKMPEQVTGAGTQEKMTEQMTAAGTQEKI